MRSTGRVKEIGLYLTIQFVFVVVITAAQGCENGWFSFPSSSSCYIIIEKEEPWPFAMVSSKSFQRFLIKIQPVNYVVVESMHSLLVFFFFLLFAEKLMKSPNFGEAWWLRQANNREFLRFRRLTQSD